MKPWRIEPVTYRLVARCLNQLRYGVFCPNSVLICSVLISEQRVIISLYNINRLVFITETECAYCAVRTGSLGIILSNCNCYTLDIFSEWLYMAGWTSILKTTSGN